MKRKRVPRQNRLAFIALACLLPIPLGILVFIAFDLAIGITAAPRFNRLLMHSVTVFLFAVMQQRLASRYLNLELRHWLRWTVLGLISSVICYQAFTAVVPAPSEFWWRARISPPPAPEHLVAENLYHAIRDFLRFGLAPFFQYVALPRQLRGRRLWLLATLLAAPLWHLHKPIAFFMLALALDHLARLRSRQPFKEPVDAPTANERINRLAARSPHAATVAQLHQVALTIIIGIVGALGGLIIHLHNQQIALIEKLLAN